MVHYLFCECFYHHSFSQLIALSSGSKAWAHSCWITALDTCRRCGYGLLL